MFQSDRYYNSENAKEFIRTISIEDFYGSRKSERREVKTKGDFVTGEDFFPLSKEELKKFGNLDHDCTLLGVRGEPNDQPTPSTGNVNRLEPKRTVIKDTTDHGI